MNYVRFAKPRPSTRVLLPSPLSLLLLPLLLPLSASAAAVAASSSSSSSSSSSLEGLGYASPSPNDDGDNVNPLLSHGTYRSWLESSAGRGYERSAYFPSPGGSDGSGGAGSGGVGGGVAIHWSIDARASELRLAVAARASGWIGFGLAESGGMAGSDVVYFAARNGGAVVDAHVGGASGMPIADVCQDWELVGSTVVLPEEDEEEGEGGGGEEGGGDGKLLIFEGRRPLNTSDTQDRALTLDDSHPTTPPHRIIAAWGDEDAVSYHRYENRVRGALRFYGRTDAHSEMESFTENMAAVGEGYIDITAGGYPLHAYETKYLEPCFSMKDLEGLGLPKEGGKRRRRRGLGNKKRGGSEGGMSMRDDDAEGGAVHVIGFEPLIDAAGPNLHHLGLVSYSQDQCRGNGVSVFIWAPGEGPLALPPDVGASIGEGSTLSYALQVHYNPVGKKAGGRHDYSGVRLYYTSQPRRHELGFLEIADPLTKLRGTAVGGGLNRYSFDCPSACSDLFDGVDSVTVIREMLHMHGKGTRMVNEQLDRDGEVLRRASVEHYDYTNAGIVSVMQRPYQYRKGDSFRTTCYYDSDDRTKFGFETKDEMCIAFLLYYPKQDIDRCGLDTKIKACAGDYDAESLSSPEDLGRSFGIKPDVCDASDS